MISLLNLLCQTISRNDPVESEAFDNGIIQEILTYINNHYTQPIRIENLARSFGVSVSWLSHEFVRFTNRSVYDYVLYRPGIRRGSCRLCRPDGTRRSFPERRSSGYPGCRLRTRRQTDRDRS